MRTQRKLLLGLLRYANGEPITACVTTGIYRDTDGSPLLYVPTIPVTGLSRERVCDLLVMTTNGLDGVVANMDATLRCSLLMPIARRRGPRGRARTWHGRIALRTDRSIASWAASVLALACCTPVGEDDCLANRIARCDTCERFFLLPTSRPARDCPTCRA